MQHQSESRIGLHIYFVKAFLPLAQLFFKSIQKTFCFVLAAKREVSVCSLICKRILVESGAPDRVIFIRFADPAQKQFQDCCLSAAGASEHSGMEIPVFKSRQWGIIGRAMFMPRTKSSFPTKKQ